MRRLTVAFSSAVCNYPAIMDLKNHMENRFPYIKMYLRKNGDRYRLSTRKLDCRIYDKIQAEQKTWIISLLGFKR